MSITSSPLLQCAGCNFNPQSRLDAVNHEQYRKMVGKCKQDDPKSKPAYQVAEDPTESPYKFIAIRAVLNKLGVQGVKKVQITTICSMTKANFSSEAILKALRMMKAKRSKGIKITHLTDKSVVFEII